MRSYLEFPSTQNIPGTHLRASGIGHGTAQYLVAHNAEEFLGWATNRLISEAEAQQMLAEYTLDLAGG